MKIKHFVPALVALAGLTLGSACIAATPVDINTADAATIAASLDGIGPAKAQAIVTYRKANGPFDTVTELSQVKGIGEATIARNKDAIKLGKAGSSNAKSGQKASQ